jgi:integrase
MTAGNAEVSKYFRSIREMAGVKYGGFSWLRKTFATYASECADQIAVDAIMGHVDDSIPGQYRQLLREKRLHKATDTVHAWLYSTPDPAEPGSTPKTA